MEDCSFIQQEIRDQDAKVIKNFIKMIEDCQIEIRIDMKKANFVQEMNYIEDTLKTKRCSMNQCNKIASMFIEIESGEWIHVCDDNLNHKIDHYPFKTVDEIVSQMRKIFHFLKHCAIKYQIFHHILFSDNILQSTHLEISNLITTFRQRIFELNQNSDLAGYDFMKTFLIRINRIYGQLQRKAVRHMSKRYSRMIK